MPHLAIHNSMAMLIRKTCCSRYRQVAHLNVTHRRRQNFYALPTAHWQMLSAPRLNLLAVFDRVDDAIDANADIADRMVEAAEVAFVDFLESAKDNNDHQEPEEKAADSSDSVKGSVAWLGAAGTSHHLDKARSTIRQLYRDWSAEGAAERHACYGPILEDLNAEFFHLDDKSDAKVLVPGAGLGRLVFEICLRGYSVRGNEISWHQLIASNWVLNHTAPGKTHDLYPFAGEFSNVISRDHQLQAVKVPDVHPGSAFLQASENSRKPHSERLGMSIGDFVGIFSKGECADEFDAIATTFFIDTAPNVIVYIKAVWNCLKPGGIWTNLGPLLWHFEERAPTKKEEIDLADASEADRTGIEEPGSFELTDEEVLLLVGQMGFDIERHEMTEETGYIHNATSMMQNIYRPSHWTARKRKRS